ncbi:unnamed protein product [Lactuca virosa]|uniref:Uncharacterized protein n=1 Tax=Lactuca virosa TaxID=75947 RepID=A0AAU9PVB7_9ASTR|nr:unnamed protein product [Lactuca virosa]
MEKKNRVAVGVPGGHSISPEGNSRKGGGGGTREGQQRWLNEGEGGNGDLRLHRRPRHLQQPAEEEEDNDAGKNGEEGRWCETHRGQQQQSRFMAFRRPT